MEVPTVKLTPLDIKKQEFKKTLRGYDPVEVDAFLEMVSDVFEDMIREKKNLSDDLLKLKVQLKDYQSVEKTLQETLVSAQQNISESRENSNREAEMIIREAELKAEKILEETKLKLAEMRNELILVKAQKDSFARRLRHLLESQMDLIEVLEMDDIGFENAARRPRKASREQPKPLQKKIDFDSRQSIQREEQVTKITTTDAAPEQASDATRWTKPATEKPGEKPAEPETGRGPRISDQLIT